MFFLPNNFAKIVKRETLSGTWVMGGQRISNPISNTQYEEFVLASGNDRSNNVAQESPLGSILWGFWNISISSGRCSRERGKWQQQLTKVKIFFKNQIFHRLARRQWVDGLAGGRGLGRPQRSQRCPSSGNVHSIYEHFSIRQDQLASKRVYVYNCHFNVFVEKDKWCWISKFAYLKEFQLKNCQTLDLPSDTNCQ